MIGLEFSVWNIDVPSILSIYVYFRSEEKLILCTVRIIKNCVLSFIKQI